MSEDNIYKLNMRLDIEEVRPSATVSDALTPKPYTGISQRRKKRAGESKIVKGDLNSCVDPKLLLQAQEIGNLKDEDK
jgi:hypothetical protein